MFKGISNSLNKSDTRSTSSYNKIDIDILIMRMNPPERIQMKISIGYVQPAYTYKTTE